MIIANYMTRKLLVMYINAVLLEGEVVDFCHAYYEDTGGRTKRCWKQRCLSDDKH